MLRAFESALMNEIEILLSWDFFPDTPGVENGHNFDILAFIVDRSELEFLVRQVVIYFGIESYSQHISVQDKSPYHCYSPNALAYVIHNGWLSRAQLANIKFDKGDDETVFLKESADTLIEDLIRTLKAVRLGQLPVELNKY